MDKSPDAFRTISEVAELLDTPAHVLRFWESRFPQIRPVKRAGGRRYYRPTDVALLAGIRLLLHDQGMTIRGVQKILREQGVRHVCSLVPAGDLVAEAEEEWAGEDAVELTANADLAEPATPDLPPGPIAAGDRVIAWPGPRPREDALAAAEPEAGNVARDGGDLASQSMADAVPVGDGAALPPDAVAGQETGLPEPAVADPEEAALPVVGRDADRPAADEDAVPQAVAAFIHEPDLESGSESGPEAPSPTGDPFDDMPLFRFADDVDPAEPKPDAFLPPAAKAPAPTDTGEADSDMDSAIPGGPKAVALAARLGALPVGRLNAQAVVPLVLELRDLRQRLHAALATAGRS